MCSCSLGGRHILLPSLRGFGFWCSGSLHQHGKTVGKKGWSEIWHLLRVLLGCSRAMCLQKGGGGLFCPSGCTGHFYHRNALLGLHCISTCVLGPNKLISMYSQLSYTFFFVKKQCFPFCSLLSLKTTPH